MSKDRTAAEENDTIKPKHKLVEYNVFFKCAMGVLYICMAENEFYTMNCGDFFFKVNSFVFYL